MHKIDIIIKCIVVGDSSCGKTSFINRIIDNKFEEKSSSTVGIDFKIKTYNYSNKNKYINKVKVYFWDTAGQERFDSLVSSYFKKGNFVLIFYDITNKKTFESIANKQNSWIDKIQKNNPILLENNFNYSRSILIGNKSDLEENRSVNLEDGAELSNKFNLHFFETSVKDKNNTQDVINYMIENIINEITVKLDKNEHLIGKEDIVDIIYEQDIINNKFYFSIPQKEKCCY